MNLKSILDIRLSITSLITTSISSASGLSLKNRLESVSAAEAILFASLLVEYLVDVEL
jgi:hypothetical protein